MGASFATQFATNELTRGIGQFSEWREDVALSVQEFGQWLDQNQLCDDLLRAKLNQILDRLESDRLSIAFVAEFSRGKSELINALFFADFEDRIVPSSAGRTTMCPTEFLWDGAHMPSIRLLPIETRKQSVSLSDLKQADEQWTVIEFDPNDAKSLKAAIAHVSDTRLMMPEEVQALGLAFDVSDGGSVGLIDVPRWRHAIVNYPHALFLQGLRVIDTPGLNAIGAEPELTHSLLPSAHAIVFLLAADTGVTASDREVWTQHLQASQTRYVVLNKIDGLWDDLRSPAQIEAEIIKQTHSVANHLDLNIDRIYPLSAQKALAAKINNDRQLLHKSRIGEFESSLANELLPQRYSLIAEQVSHEFGELLQKTRGQLAALQRGLSEQEFELNSLRGKNRHSIQHVAMRIRSERTEFEAGLKKMQGLRAVHTRQKQKVFSIIGIDTLKSHVRQARDRIGESNFSASMREAMHNLITSAFKDLNDMHVELKEAFEMMRVMNVQFNTQFAMDLSPPADPNMDRWKRRVGELDAVFNRQFGPVSLLTNEKWALARKFFDSIALELKKVYLGAGRDAEAWLASVIAPIEGQLQFQQNQLRARMDSVKRVLEASDHLESRILDLKRDQSGIDEQLLQVGRISNRVHNALVSRTNAEQTGQ